MADKYIIRGDRSGVFFGEIESREGREVKMRNVRRLYSWGGATDVTQLAVDGVSRPQSCKFTMYADEAIILDAIEIRKCSEKAITSIEGVGVWKV